MTFDDFLTHVLPYTPGCPDAVAVDHVRKAARAFCSRTLVWNYAANPIAAEAGKANYTLQLGDDQELVRVLLVEVDGTEYEIPSGSRGRQLVRYGGCNVCVMQGAQDFTLAPAPQIDGLEIITDIAVKPSLAGNYWPDDFAEFVPDIAAGAIASLCLIPKVEWSDVATAQVQQSVFNGRIGTVGTKVSKGLGSTSKRQRVCFF